MFKRKPEEKYKECHICGGLFNKYKMKKVEIVNISSLFEEDIKSTQFYCKEHAPKFDRVIKYGFKTKYVKDSVEVTENGKIVK